GWIAIPGFGEIAPRRDNAGGGRQYLTARTEDGEFAKVAGEFINGGPETWYFEFDQPFWLADRSNRCLEATISLLEGGRYAVKFRDGEWPTEVTGGWSVP
ncbi:MAG: hypothetical protein ACRDOT_05625, partial [Aeromicrobium sp.]